MSATARFTEQFQKQPRTRVRTRAKPLQPIDIAIDDAKRRASSGEWSWSKGATFLGLHALCHKMIYGIIPDELYVSGVYRAASRMAAKALHELFDDDADAMAAFVRWSWEREKRKHTWALANGVDRNRLSWKWQFSRGLLTDYRIAIQQKRR